MFKLNSFWGKFIINVEQDVDLFGKVFHFSKDTPIPKWYDTPRKETRQLPLKMKEFQCVWCCESK